MRIILACDRSAGHILPAKCLASCLKGDNIYFFAPSYYFKPLLKKEGWKVFGTSLKLRNIVFESIFRFWEAIYIICRLRPHRVAGFGGRDAFFIILWARLLHIDAVLYEPNVMMGRANRALYPLVKIVYHGFPVPYAPDKNIAVGIPLRDSLRKIDKAMARENLGLEKSSVTILCFGGSQGSEFINNAFKKFVIASKSDFQIIHVTGAKQKRHFSEFYDKINKKAVCYDFCGEMDLLYSAADFVISRSGALTVAEVSFYRLPALFIPYPGAGAHQYANAAYLEERKACFVFRQDSFLFDKFSECIENLIADGDTRRGLSNNIGRINVAVSSRDFCRKFMLQAYL
ncbi:MAG: hypothetical protein B1H08_00930 [Candidatus Omnitrophica bacterium 4484_171]|nr:MAG: hypothetical protein B1H08_00930 [Candidatus Omnitrophica bacterium 4484_171]